LCSVSSANGWIFCHEDLSGGGSESDNPRVSEFFNTGTSTSLEGQAYGSFSGGLDDAYRRR
jgi:hypothetical protein